MDSKKQLPVVVEAEEPEVLEPEEEYQEGSGSFEPTPQMIMVLEAAVKYSSGFTPEEWCKSARVSTAAWTRWKRDKLFIKWFTQAFDTEVKLKKLEWLKLGIDKMHTNEKYWVNMGATVFYPKKEGTLGIYPTDPPKRTELEEDLLDVLKDEEKFNKKRKKKASEADARSRGMVPDDK